MRQLLVHGLLTYMLTPHAQPTAYVHVLCPYPQIGTYNAAGNQDRCKTCPLGTSTVNDPARQASENDCLPSPGYGRYAAGTIPRR